ncbi:hypothetical protein GMRT_14888 [Giardia muris]|uniref:Uncharacterized protein n=1 Tax=Giardia muris TaxID=5742 RepID=A0A4Z1SQ35_GIAMU|nr:hypothetical protein GMRT_14888 [Giardia muris]|eukprot:TNJ26995.1 hypothetical protein GMRT_14888 [Giardia muris]
MNGEFGLTSSTDGISGASLGAEVFQIKYAHARPLPAKITFFLSLKTGKRTTVYTDKLVVSSGTTFHEVEEWVGRVVGSVEHFHPDRVSGDERLQIRLKTHSRDTQSRYERLTPENMSFLLHKGWAMRTKYTNKNEAQFDLFVYGTASSAVRRCRIPRALHDEPQIRLDSVVSEEGDDGLTRFTIAIVTEAAPGFRELLKSLCSINSDLHYEKAEPISFI